MARGRLLEAAGRHGVEVREAPPATPSAAASPARRRRLALDRARFERLLKPWRLLDRVGHREFGPGRD